MYRQRKEKQNSVFRSQTSTTVCEIWHELKHKGNSLKQSKINKHERKFKKLRTKIPQNNVTHTLEHTVDTSYQEPINLSETSLNEDEIRHMTKGPSFVPLPKNVDWLDTRIALDKFSSKLRSKLKRTTLRLVKHHKIQRKQLKKYKELHPGLKIQN